MAFLTLYQFRYMKKQSGIELEDSYNERMAGFIALYAAFMQSDPFQGRISGKAAGSSYYGPNRSFYYRSAASSRNRQGLGLDGTHTQYEAATNYGNSAGEVPPCRRPCVARSIRQTVL